MASGVFLLLFLTVQRLGELQLAKHNTARLLAKGAYERGAEHYPLMVGFHATWLAVMWFIGWDISLQLGWAAVFIALQGLRIWILASLGSRWTTRIIILNEPLVRRGPYKYIPHPNYTLVVGEIAVVPLALGAPLLALIFSIAHAGVLYIRIKAENRALAEITAREEPQNASAA